MAVRNRAPRALQFCDDKLPPQSEINCRDRNQSDIHTSALRSHARAPFQLCAGGCAASSRSPRAGPCAGGITALRVRLAYRYMAIWCDETLMSFQSECARTAPLCWAERARRAETLSVLICSWPASCARAFIELPFADCTCAQCMHRWYHTAQMKSKKPHETCRHNVHWEGTPHSHTHDNEPRKAVDDGVESTRHESRSIANEGGATPRPLRESTQEGTQAAGTTGAARAFGRQRLNR